MDDLFSSHADLPVPDINKLAAFTKKKTPPPRKAGVVPIKRCPQKPVKGYHEFQPNPNWANEEEMENWIRKNVPDVISITNTWTNDEGRISCMIYAPDSVSIKNKK